ncbi:MAG TPA: LuxR C-terminal-related transcriptional regulator [Rubricoccaceae bacterium]
MSLTLSTGDLERLEAASRALLSPLAAPTVDAWRQNAMDAAVALLGGRSAMFALPHPGLEFYASTGVDPHAVRDMTAYIAERARNTGEAPDPLINRFYQRRDELNLEAFDYDLMRRVTGEGQDRSPFYNEVWARHGLHRVHVLYVTTPAGVANLHVHHEPGRPPFGGDGGLAVLRALLPSFKAGLSAVHRLSAHRTALAATLDVLAEPLAAFDADGREAHRNGALDRLIGAEPERAAVEGALWLLARDLRRLAYPLRREGAAPLVALERGVRTARGHYTLRPTLLPEGLAGPGTTFLVAVEPDLAPRPPSADEVRARFGLTRREAEVAVLLAEGLRNGEVAERLFVSPRTVKRHVEGVLGKLDVPNRASVGAKLRGTD